MKTISLLNLKGGVGKTTTAINLAKGLANKGKKVLLIDTDMQANATSIFLENEMIKEDYVSFANLLKDKGGDVNNYIYTIDDNLDMIGSDLSVGKIELELRNSIGRNPYNILDKIIRKIENNYDYCIIDCSPTINLVTVNIIKVSDEIIIPIKIDKFALKGYQTTLESIEEIQEEFELNSNIKIFFTMVNRNNIDKNIIKSIKANRFKTTIRFQAKPITESSFKNDVLIDNNQYSKVKEDYILFINEFAEREDSKNV